MEKKIKKKAMLYGLAAVLLTSVLGALIYNYGAFVPVYLAAAPPISAPRNALLSTFSSTEALRSFLKSNARIQGPYTVAGPLDSDAMRAYAVNTPSVASAGSKEITFEHSTTNIQVANVDEADIVKTDDLGYMYVVSGQTVYILKAFPFETAALISKITFDSSQVAGIFVSGNRLAVLGSNDTNQFKVLSTSLFAYYDYWQQVKTFVNIYDIHDRTHPTLLRDLVLTGHYINSRMIGDYVYFVTNREAYVENETVNLPQIYSNGQNKTIEPSEIRYCNGTDDRFLYTTFVAMNMQNTTQSPVYLPIMLGAAGNMYVSLNNMYLTFRDWSWNGNTTIYRVHIQADNMTVEAKGKVPGAEANQYSMDEYDNHFRIQTTTLVDWTPSTNLYILDMNLSIVGRLEGLALGENFHSARFMGNRAYLVTFEKIDPLFVIDLSNSTHPTVLGELKVPGYSDYLHPYDETHLIGVGKETVPAEQEYFAWYQGIKISLFDVSNVSNPVQIAKTTIGDRGSDSLALTDPKAFLFDKSKNLLSIPIKVAKIYPSQYPGEEVPPWAYGTPIGQGAFVFEVTLEHGFVLKGNITHIEPGMDVNNEAYQVRRTLYIENVLYTVSDRKVKLNMLEDLTPITEISLS